VSSHTRRRRLVSRNVRRSSCRHASPDGLGYTGQRGRFQHAALAHGGMPVLLHAPRRWDRPGIRLDFGGQLPPSPLTSGIFTPLVGFAGDGPPIAALTTVPERAPWHARALGGLPDRGVTARSVASCFVWMVVARRPTVVIVLIPVLVRRRGA